MTVSSFSARSPLSLRTAAVAVASASLGALIVLGLADRAPAAPAPRAAISATDVVSAGDYDPMQDYVDTLIWWAGHPDWLPSS